MFSHFLDKDSKALPECEQRPFLEAEETLFFKRVQKALPNCLIFPRLPLAAILEPHVSNEKKRALMSQKLNERHIDFGIFDHDLNLLCVLELEKEQAQEEEYPTRQLLKKAGIKCIRWSRASLPSAEQILRTLAPFSELDAPKIESSMQTIGKLFLDDDPKEIGQLQEKAFTYIEHGNPNALSLAALKRITPENFIQKEYPHIWQKICLFAGDPGYLKNYLESLFIQNRPVKRRGLPKHVANEVIALQAENARFVVPSAPDPVWDPTFLHR
ncbi:DUF2726 domain-containing protein [Undibacterium danionis]|uniref:DUF2726 domain-containing protein n=1 Tax=Undibacterium danionis TaxID=1812100 RepID=A0ABV6IBF4_9BURK